MLTHDDPLIATGAATAANADAGGASVPPADDVAVPPERRLSVGQWAIVLLAFLVPVLWWTAVPGPFADPKSALLLVALGPGLVVLVWLAAHRDRPALAALAFLLAASLATIVAHEPMMSLLGEFSEQNGLLLTAACVSLWALGRTIDDQARPMLVLALIAGAFLNAAVAWLQMSTDLGIRALQPYLTRAGGLMGNPVELAALCAAAFWLATAREREATRPMVWWGTVGLLAGAVELSGSRIALVVVVGIVGWHALMHLRDRHRARAGALVAAALLGVLLAVAIGSSSSASARVGQAPSTGLGTRVEVWSTGLSALADRPLLGYGPGRFESVSSPRRSLEIAKFEGPDVLYGDAHNLVVEYAVATGLIGLALLATWMVLSVKRSRGPLLGFFAVAVLVGLVEPQYVGITPLIALALGGAMSRAPNPRLTDAPRPVSRAAVVFGALLAVVGLAAGVSFLMGGVHYEKAVNQHSLRELDAAQEWLPPWPQIAATRAELTRLASKTSNTEALGFQREVLHRDGEDPAAWYTLGSLRYLLHDYAGARVAYRHALVRNPWSFFGLAGSYRSSLALDDIPAATHWRTELCRLGANYCPARSELTHPERVTAP